MTVVPRIHYPPQIYPEASWFTVRVGVRYKSLRMLVRRAERSSASQQKSPRALWATLVIVTLLPVT